MSKTEINNNETSNVGWSRPKNRPAIFMPSLSRLSKSKSNLFLINFQGIHSMNLNEVTSVLPYSKRFFELMVFLSTEEESYIILKNPLPTEKKGSELKL